MNPRGMVDRIYKEDHYKTLLHSKYESSVPCGFREDFFYVFPIVSLWDLMTPRVGPFFTPGAWLAGFIKRTTTHCYIQIEPRREKTGLRGFQQGLTQTGLYSRRSGLEA